MKQIIQSHRTGKLALKVVPEPIVKERTILVRTHASLISAGTERMVISFAKKNIAGKAKARPDLVKKVISKIKKDGLKSTFESVMARLDEPLPLGYSASGEVVAIGSGAEGKFEVGQRVAIAGAGVANHADLNLVPINLAARIPHSVKDEEACFGTIGAIALHAVRNLKTQLGDTIGILGMGLVGQLAAQFLRISGNKVIAIDYNQARLDLAASLGANYTINLSNETASNQALDLTEGRGCDGIIIAAATSSSEPFQTAANIARDRSCIVMVGVAGTTFPYADFMKKELKIIVSRSYGPGRYDHDYENKGVKYPEGWIRWTETENLKECLHLMRGTQNKKLIIEPLISHQFPFEKAEDAYSLILNNKVSQMGVVLSYPKEPSKIQPKNFTFLPSQKTKRCVLGIIGAGNFAKTILLPQLKNNKDVILRTIVTTRGSTSSHNGEVFGFENCSTDPEVAINDPKINALVIATRHNTHASLTALALEKGKSVFVEKPLALNYHELNQVINARNNSPETFFQVGFNRQFAPMSIQAKNELLKYNCPKFMTFRINAGPIPQNHWVHREDEGGGRILGEVCHFIDLAQFFAGSMIKSVHANASDANTPSSDNVAVSLSFEDGSLATILYTARGDASQNKERYEIFCAEKNILIDDFRRLEISFNNKRSVTSGSQNKGFKPALKAFINAVITKSTPPINEEKLIETTNATIAVLTSISTGKRIIF